MKRLSLLVFLLFSCMAMSIAQRTVTGVVTDLEGEALIGASVIAKGTSVGTITDIDGSFSLSVPEGTQMLEITYTGFESMEVDVSTSSNVTISMAEGALLDEVVVTGYGTQNRQSITGSVASIDSRQLESIPIVGIDQLLQGQAPGLTVLSGSGQPGTNDVSVILRGPSSITGGTSPIYILDGMQISPEDFGALNANDIESVSVLKDASSTAIYGASGANGVILIKTKTGKAGATRVTYNAQYGVANRTRDRFDMMNSTEKLSFEEKARRGPGWNLSPENPNNAGLSEEELALNATELERLRGINTNWRDIVFRQGRIQTHNLSVSGGDENTTFMFSGNYYDEEGILTGSDFNRGTLRANITEKISDRLTLGIRSSFGSANSRFVQAENAINLNNPAALAYLTNPYDVVRDEDGEFAFGSVGRNPVEEVSFNYDETRTLKAVGQAFIEFEPVDNFKFVGRYGVDYTNLNSKNFIDPDSRLSTTVQGQQGQLSKEVDNTIWYTYSNTLNYNKIFSDRHSFDVLVGQETRRRTRDDYEFNAFGLTGGLDTPAGTTAGSVDAPDFIPTIGGLEREKVLNSYFSRVNYTLDDKYNFTAGARRDGSSVFGVNRRWGTFWNAGFSWIASRENFLLNNSTISYLKFGISYGTNGNSEGIGEREQFPVFNNGSYAGGGALTTNPEVPGNPNLQWETLRGFNTFVDFGLFDNFLDGSIALYRNDTEDLFITQEVSRTGGGTSLSVNGGSMRNQGVEFEMNANLLRSADAFVTLGVQFAYNDNEITSLGQVSEFEQGTSIIREGLPLGTHYIEEWGGVDPATGNPLYIDSLGNVTDNFGNAGPKAEFGSFYAPWSGGVTLGVGYKGFSLNVLGSWVYGNTLFNNQTFFQENPNFAQFNMSTVMNNVWENPGDVTDVQRIGTARQFSSKDLEDGSFFRLRTVTLGYDLPIDGKLLGAFTGVRFFVQGNNLLTITNFSGFDPEDDDNIAQYGFPNPRRITVGANIDF